MLDNRPPMTQKQESDRRTLSPGVAFWALAAILFAGFASNAAASPLYQIYQSQLRFSATTTTSLYTVYAVCALLTWLFLGPLSDYIGRRPVMFSGLVVGGVAFAVFLGEHSLVLLFLARALQGVAVTLIAGAASAALIDLRPESRAAPVVGSAAPIGGQALGVFIASPLAQYAPAPTHLIWWLFLALFVMGALAVVSMPEPGPVRSGAAQSLRPHVHVPHAARGAFLTAVPCFVGVWAVGAVYLSLGPSLAAELVHSNDLLWGGALIFLLFGLAATTSTVLAKTNPTAVMLGGLLALTAGSLVTFASVETSAPALLYVGAAVTGLGFGPAFTGAYRSTLALAPPEERAALIASIYIVIYAATAIPVVIAGIATTHYGWHGTALVYSLAVAGVAALSTIALVYRIITTRAAPPPQPPSPASQTTPEGFSKRSDSERTHVGPRSQ